MNPIWVVGGKRYVVLRADSQKRIFAYYWLRPQADVVVINGLSFLQKKFLFLISGYISGRFEPPRSTHISSSKILLINLARVLDIERKKNPPRLCPQFSVGGRRSHAIGWGAGWVGVVTRSSHSKKRLKVSKFSVKNLTENIDISYNEITYLS